MDGLRRKGGGTAAHAHQDAADPNTVTVLTQWNTESDAKTFAENPLKDPWQKSGAVGKPSVMALLK